MTYMLDPNICSYAIKNKQPQVLRRLMENIELRRMLVFQREF